MTSLAERRRKDTRTLLIQSLLIALAAGIFEHIYVETRIDLLHHLAIALWVALAMTLLIDYNIRRRHLEEIREDVWGAVFRRLVPERAADEIIMTIKENLYRSHCHYTLTFIDSYQNTPAGCFVLRRQLRYTIQNVSDRAMTIPIVSRIAATVAACDLKTIDGTSIRVPRHVKLTIRGNPVEIKAGKNLIVEEKEPPGELPRHITLSEPIHLEGNETAVVTMISEELMPLAQRQNSYVFTRPTIDLSVHIENQCPGVLALESVDLNHRSGSSFQEIDQNNYHFRGVVLPGQSFEVRWIPTSDKA